VYILSEDIITYLEKLVLVKFNEDEKERVRVEINRIVDLFNVLKNMKELDIYEPLFHVHEISSPLRDDEVLDKLDEEYKMLKENAVLVQGYVKAPKTMVE